MLGAASSITFHPINKLSPHFAPTVYNGIKNKEEQLAKDLNGYNRQWIAD